MNSEKLYYEAPPQEQFENMKKKAIELWQTVFKENGSAKIYQEEKINNIKDIDNVRDNFMFMFAMFDPFKQARLFGALNEQTRKAVVDRLDDETTKRLADNMFLTPEFNYDGL